MINVNILKLDPQATMPFKAHEEDACFDLFSCLTHVKEVKISYSVYKATVSPIVPTLTIVKSEELKEKMPVLGDGPDRFVQLPANSSAIIPTGIIMGIPNGYRVDVKARSGRAAKYRQYLTNSVGTIDCGYKEEIFVMLTNASAQSLKLSHGDKIAQFSVEKVLPVILTGVYNQEDVYQADSLRTSGLGSTGD